MTAIGWIPWNDRLGTIGESAIETRLKYFSHPMKNEPPYDIGIDFLCELFENGSPTSKFFLVQAKGTQYFDDKWGRSFDKETIQFWLTRPFPLYVIVYDNTDKNCYWMSIEEQRNKIVERMQSDTKTVYLTVERTRILRLDENSEFVQRIKDDLQSLNFRLNIIRGTPEFVGEGYVREIHVEPLPDILLPIFRDRVRINLNYLIYNHLLRRETGNALRLCDFLTGFDKSHYDHFVLCASICRFLNMKEEACSNYRQAIEICKRDKNWDIQRKPTDPSIKDLITLIENEMKNLGCESSK